MTESPRRPRAYVHLGTHKTGTTSFQHWASGNREAIAENLGLTYYVGRFRPSHIELPMLCLRPDRSMPMRVKMPEWQCEEWLREAEEYIRTQVRREAPSLLVSAEGLSYIRHQDEVERLIDLLRPRAITVLVVLREPSSFLSSYTDTLAKMGFSPSKERDSFAYVEDDSWLTDYPALTGVFSEVLGPKAVTTVNYEDAMYRYGSVIPAILDRWGFDVSRAPSWAGVRRGVTKPNVREKLRRSLGSLGR